MLHVRNFSIASLAIDCDAEIDHIATTLRAQLRGPVHRRGLVLGLSSGIDSSVCAGLAARAVGRENVFWLFMPESDSDPESLRLGRLVAERRANIACRRRSITASSPPRT